MKKVFPALLLHFIAFLSMAQSDLSFQVSKKDTLCIYPDSMYFDSHVARTFLIGGIPPGCRAKGSFSGGSIYIHNNVLTLIPVYVLKESEVTPLDRKYFNGFKSVTADYYTAELRIDVFDSSNKLVSFLSRKCYIKYEHRPNNIQISAGSMAPGAKGILKITRSDSTKLK